MVKRNLFIHHFLVLFFCSLLPLLSYSQNPDHLTVIKPEEINDDMAAVVARDIAKKIESEMEYPGQIKVTVIRESRAIEYAK